VLIIGHACCACARRQWGLASCIASPHTAAALHAAAAGRVDAAVAPPKPVDTRFAHSKPGQTCIERRRSFGQVSGHVVHVTQCQKCGTSNAKLSSQIATLSMCGNLRGGQRTLVACRCNCVL